MLDILLLSALCFLAMTLARRSQKESLLRIARLVFVLVFVLFAVNLLLVTATNPPVEPLISSLLQSPAVLFSWEGTGTVYSWLAVLGLLAGSLGVTVMLYSLIYRRPQLIRASVKIVLIISPFVMIAFAQGTAQWIRYRAGEQFRENVSAPLLQNKNSSRRIVWLIFDEMDYRLSFVDRPDTLQLPELDRLRNESIFASNAYPPGEETETSMPALINGDPVSEARRSAPNELLLVLRDNRIVPWSTQPNVFSATREMGLNSGLAGWHHPYCRIIGGSLTQCSWEATSHLFLQTSDLTDLITSKDVSVGRSMLRVARGVLIPAMVRFFLPKNPRIWRESMFKEFNSIHQRSLSMVSDPNLQLVLVHYPLPHPPGIYDRKKDEFSFTSNSGYLDNLVLVDQVLKQLRERMMDTQVWGTTTILISSDHRLRADSGWKSHHIWKPSITKEDPLVVNSKRDDRVPFILKIPGENKPLVYDKRLNTVLSHDLILEILAGRISTNEEAVIWLNQQSLKQTALSLTPTTSKTGANTTLYMKGAPVGVTWSWSKTQVATERRAL